MTSRLSLASLGVVWLLWLVPLDAETPKAHIDALGDPLPPQALHRFGTARFCTQAEVTALVLSADGKLLAAADRDGRGYVWDATNGKERLRTPAGHGKRLALSPDAQWLALGDESDFEVRNLRLNDAPRLQFGKGAGVFAFTPDSKALAVTQPETVEVLLLDLIDGKELRRFAGMEGVIADVVFSPDGKSLAAAAPRGEADEPSVHLIVWDARNGTKRKEWDFAAKQIQKLVFLPDNQTLVGQFGSRLAAWNSTTAQLLPKIRQTVGSSFALDDAGKWLASSDGPKISEWATGKEVYEFESPALIRHLAMSGDGKLLAASAASFESASPRLMLWDLTTGKERTVADGHRHYVDAVAFAHDGRKIATASNVEGRARLWDARTSKLLQTLNLDSLAARRSGGPRNRRTLLDGLAFSADRPELFVAGQRWDLTKGEPILLEGDDEFNFEQTNSYRAVLSADARQAASYLSDHSILFWDPAKAKAIQKIFPSGKKERGDWSAFAFTPDGKYAALGKWFPLLREDDDTPPQDTIQLWDIHAGKRVRSMRASYWPIVRMMLAPDGETLAVICLPTKLELWHLPTGRLLREMRLIEGDAQPLSVSLAAAAFAPHGQWLAFTHREGEILLLETFTGKLIRTLRGHEGLINSLAFAPDSRSMLSGGRDTTALLWPMLSPAPAVGQDPERLWQELGGATEPAYRVVWHLLAHPQDAIAVLSRRLLPDSGATDKEIRALIHNLSSAKFAQRDVAMRRLKQIGTRSLPTLEQALKKAPDLETGRRIQALLKTVETSLTPETLRDLRGMLILEMIATAPARQLLAEIAAGDPDAAKTRLARAALQRLKKN